MAIFDHLYRPQFQPPNNSFIFKLLTICLPLLCLLSWASSTATPAPPLPPPSALAASEVLKTRGYHLFADLIAATAADGNDSWNGTGTVFAPPDFVFSFAIAKFNDYRRYPPPRPSATLLLYHTLTQPLPWYNLAARADGDELLTWQINRCVFVSRGFNGDLAISGSKKSISAIKIRHPELYVDDNLVVHGVDGVLDPGSVSMCSSRDRTAKIKSQVDRSYLDHAIKALRRKGFGVAATALALKRSVLTSLPAVTVFAPPDASLFSASNGFRYDFLHHVVPKRHRFNDIASLSAGTVIETLSPNKTIDIRSENGGVTVNGVAIDSSEVYQNGWIVVLSVSRSIDDENLHIPGGSSDSYIARGPFPGGFAYSPSPASYFVTDPEVNSQSPREFSESKRAGVPSPSPSYSFPQTVGEALAYWKCSPGVSLANSNGAVSKVSPAVGGEDIFCPVTVLRLRDLGAGSSVHVEHSPPYAAHSQLSEKFVQSGPSHVFNKQSEPVMDSVLSDDKESGQLSVVSTAEIVRRELSSPISSGSEANGKVVKPSVPSNADQLSVADDLFFYI